MGKLERIFYGVSLLAMLFFIGIVDFYGERVNQDDYSLLAVVFGSFVIGAAITWGAHMWPKETKGMGFE